MENPEFIAGTLLANRFEIDRLAGKGGMGAVYRAYDRHRGEVVALKLLQTTGTDDATRFAREAQILAELHHSAIVSYVAHGQTAAGQHFLAMEWLDGHDLAHRLSHGPLSLREALQVVKRVAEALTVAHQRGIVHRDLKPTNVFLPGDDIASCKLLDFGIARFGSSSALTHTGMVVGTPEYMAPEQARGVLNLTSATDIFSLGCVLYECLSGSPPFGGGHLAAVLVRILFEEPAPISSRRPGVPEALVSLLGDMLHKAADQRIADAAQLLQRLAGIAELPDSPFSRPLLPPPAPTFAENEQHLFSLVIAAGPKYDRLHAETQLPTHVHADLAHRRSLLTAVQTLGGRAEYLIDGTLVATVPQTDSAQDQVVMAARTALLVKERWPAATVAVTTGRGTARGATAIGEVSERAVRHLERQTGEQLAAPGDSGVWLDALSARLLDPRFIVSRRAEWSLLTGEEKAADESRPLLGKPTECVGREAELGSLEAQLNSCIEESAAHVVLVTASPGIGKSRLRHEFLRRVEKTSTAVTVLLGRGDLTSAGAPYGILAAAVRRLCQITEGEPLAEQQQHLRNRIAQHVPPPDRERVVLFIGELCQVPFAEAGQPVLQAARREPKVMRDCLRRAAVDWLRAECAAAPVLLVLDDLQWGDTLTVSLLDEALQELHDMPLLVLAFARPEVYQVFPEIWQHRKMQQISLRGLSKRACERLIRQVLGKDVPAEALARAVEQAAGNALFLEELIRAIADGSWAEQNHTVMAMLQARLGRLNGNVRRAVRAAAVFGQTFWVGGVCAILASPPDSPEPKKWITGLVDAELVQKQVASRMKGDAEYCFRHALVRDAVYDLLTPSDLGTGHRIAGEFLQRAGEQDAAVIAEHFERGGDAQRAAEFYAQAAEKALACYDLGGAIDKSRRAVACGAAGERLGRLLGIQSIVQLRNNSWSAALACGEAALPLLPPQSRRWIETASAVLFVVQLGGLTPTSIQPTEINAALLEALPTPDTLAPLAEAVAWLCSSAGFTAQHELADAAYARLVALCALAPAEDLSVQRWLSWGTCDYLFVRRPAPWTIYTAAQRGVQQFLQVGDRLNQTMLQLGLGLYLAELGELTAAEALLTAEWLKLQDQAESMARGLAATNLGILLFRTLHPAAEHRLQLARAVAQALREQVGEAPDFIGCGYMVRARVYTCEGRLAEAREDAWRGYQLPQVSNSMRRLFAAGLLRLLGEQGQLIPARELALQELETLCAHAGNRCFELSLRSECVSALYQAGDSERARAELQVALAQISVQAADIPKPQRMIYLTHNLDCALVRKLAVDLLGADPLADLLAAA